MVATRLTLIDLPFLEERDISRKAIWLMCQKGSVLRALVYALARFLEKSVRNQLPIQRMVLSRFGVTVSLLEMLVLSEVRDYRPRQD